MTAENQTHTNTKNTMIKYSIPGDDEGGRLWVYGDDKNADHIVFFCGGWPDDSSTLAPFAQRLATSTTNTSNATSAAKSTSESSSTRTGTSQKILCAVTCLPGYDTPLLHLQQNKSRVKTFSIDEVVASLREACKVLRHSVSTNPKATLTAVFHDWGCFFGAKLVNHIHEEFPGYFSSVIFLDILPPVHHSLGVAKSVNLLQSVIMMLYTSLFAVCHALQRYVSNVVAVPVLTLGFAVIKVFNLTPTGRIDDVTFQTVQRPKLSFQKLIYMMYPYLNMYKGILSGNKNYLSGFHLPISLVETPVLYMYGMEKNINFHNHNMVSWLGKEGARTGSKTRVIPVAKAGHWLFLQQEDICYEAVRSFLLE